MSKNRQKQILLPPWNMPSDPVKAVFWFMHWLLQVLVRFFWIPIIVMGIYETYLNASVGGLFNGIVGGVITLLIGGAVWGLLYLLLLFLNVSTTISKTISEVNRVQQNFTSRRPLYPFPKPEADDKVVEGTITDLEEERKKRRRE